MKQLFNLFSRNTRFWLILFLFIFLILWIFHQIFFSKSISENISIYSHQKQGNRAFFDYLQELGIPLSIVYQPAYIWTKSFIQDLNKVNQLNKNQFQYKYIFIEKDNSLFWSESEAQWFRQWLELGNQIIIFTQNPIAYWEALMLPIVYQDKRQEKRSKNNFDVGFELSIEKILRNFIYDNLYTSKPKKTQSVSAQKCYFNSSSKPINIISNDLAYNRRLMYSIQKSGWKNIDECRYGNQSFLWKWAYKKGKITFVYSPKMLSNEMIADVDNISFIKKAISLNSKDLIIWDAYHHGISQSPNLWYYIFHTIPGRVFIWLIIGFLFYFWCKNKNLKKYPLSKNKKELQAASLLYFHALTSKFSKKKIIHDAYYTLREYLNKKPRSIQEKNTSTKNKLKYIYNYFNQ